MKVKGVNPETGEEFEAEAEHVDNDFIDSMLNFKMTAPMKTAGRGMLFLLVKPYLILTRHENLLRFSQRRKDAKGFSWRFLRLGESHDEKLIHL